MGVVSGRVSAWFRSQLSQGARLGCRATPESRNASADIRVGAWGSMSPVQCWRSHGPKRQIWVFSPFSCWTNFNCLTTVESTEVAREVLLASFQLFIPRKKVTNCFSRLCPKASQPLVLWKEWLLVSPWAPTQSLPSSPGFQHLQHQLQGKELKVSKGWAGSFSRASPGMWVPSCCCLAPEPPIRT